MTLSVNARAGALPPFRSILAVCAHPDDESFGLGAVLSSWFDAGATVRLLCFTRGEASTLGGVPGDLADVRAAELESAAASLGVESVRLCGFADGALADVDPDELGGEVRRCAASSPPDCLVVFDDGGITGHPDHQAATDAARLAATRLHVPVLAWTLPSQVASALNDEFDAGFVGRQPDEIDVRITVDRRRQFAAIACHASQSATNPVLWRRLDLLGSTESLRWLVGRDE